MCLKIDNKRVVLKMTSDEALEDGNMTTVKMRLNLKQPIAETFDDKGSSDYPFCLGVRQLLPTVDKLNK